MTVRVLIRPDHGPGVGGGHLGRCLALAEAFVAEGCEVVLAADEAPVDWVDRYVAAGASATTTATMGDADVVVFDGYRFGPADHRSVAARATVLVVDDHGITDVGRADVIVDQNLGAAISPAWPDDADVLLGPGFALVRGEVRAARRSDVVAAAPAEGAPVLVAAGGAPPGDWLDLLRSSVAAAGWRGPVATLQGVADVGAVLAGARLGVLAAGSTVWDALCAGLPCVVVAFVDNQRPSARRLGKAGYVVDGGDVADVSPASIGALVAALLDDDERRAAMVQAGLDLVDGRGASRVARTVLDRRIGPKLGR